MFEMFYVLNVVQKYGLLHYCVQCLQ